MCQFAVNCGSTVYARVIGPYNGANPSSLVAAIAPWSDVRAARASPHRCPCYSTSRRATGEFFLLCSRGCWRLISDKLLLGRDKAFNASIAHKHDLPEDLEDSRVHIIAAARTHFTDADQARRSDPFAILGLTLGAT